jgi:hypothetical protein
MTRPNFQKRPWRPDEDAALIADYQAGLPMKACGAGKVGPDRTEFACEERIRALIRRGVIEARPQARLSRSGTKDAEMLAFWAERRERLARAKPRPCMCCHATFDSEGPHNRMCDRCRRNPPSVEDYRMAVRR